MLKHGLEGRNYEAFFATSLQPKGKSYLRLQRWLLLLLILWHYVGLRLR
jgi:hypothetical protein